MKYIENLYPTNDQRPPNQRGDEKRLSSAALCVRDDFIDEEIDEKKIGERN